MEWCIDRFSRKSSETYGQNKTMTILTHETNDAQELPKF